MELGVVSIDAGARFGSVTVGIVLMESGMGTGMLRVGGLSRFTLGPL